jgi:hypothetical protein
MNGVMDAQLFDRETAETYATWFKALSDPTRIQILNLLAVAGDAPHPPFRRRRPASGGGERPRSGAGRAGTRRVSRADRRRRAAPRSHPVSPRHAGGQPAKEARS